MVWLEQHTGIHRMILNIIILLIKQTPYAFTDSRAVSLPFLASPIGPLIYLSLYIALIVLGKQ